MLIWIWLAVVVFALVLLAVTGARLLGRLAGLRRAAVRLRRRQAESARLQDDAAELQRAVAGLQERLDAIAAHRG